MSKRTQPAEQKHKMARSSADNPNTSESQQWLSVSAETRHELRTPLNHIIGYSEMLIEETEAGGLQDLTTDLRKIHAAGKDLLNELDTLFGTKSAHPNTRQSGTLTSHSEIEPASQKSADKSKHNANYGRILVVDDNDGNRELLARRLEHEGYTVQIAVHGEDALAHLREEPIDLILLDVMMPGLSGYDVLDAIKRDSYWQNIPVIMISALDELQSVVRCIEHGAEDYLPKPFDPVLLRARIGACMEKKRLRDQELVYLKDVTEVTEAAATIEAGNFSAASLDDVAKREDELGRLARVVQRMAIEVQARERQLRHQIEQLHIKIDETKKSRQVAEITETDYFHELRERARTLRNKSRGA